MFGLKKSGRSSSSSGSSGMNRSADVSKHYLFDRVRVRSSKKGGGRGGRSPPPRGGLGGGRSPPPICKLFNICLRGLKRGFWGL